MSKNSEWTDLDLYRQFEGLRAAGGLNYFDQAALLTASETSDLLALGSRETKLVNKLGDIREDGPHGFGILQVDIETDREWCLSGAWKRLDQAVLRGAELFAEKRNYLANRKVVSPQYVFCSYNCGQGNVMKDLKAGRDPNQRTAGGDYGRDVLARKALFDRFLAGYVPEGA